MGHWPTSRHRQVSSRVVALLTCALSCLLSAGAAAQGEPPKASAQPCSAPQYRQFDFWIGHWDVYQPDGKLAGDNLIEPILGGCALRETWSGRGGFAGTSLNAYDAIDKR